MARGGMLEVVLADDDEPGTGPDRPRPAAGGGSAAPRRHDHGRRGPGRRVALIGAAVVVALAAAALLDDGRASERTERLAAVPGLLAPLEGPPRVLWRGPGGDAATVAVGHGLVVATARPPMSGHVLVAVDAATGAERWRAPLPEVSDDRDRECVVMDTARSPAAAAAPSPPPPRDGARPTRPATHVVCRLVSERAALADGAQGFAASRLVVFDARTGSRVADRPLDSRFSSLAVAGPHLLLVEVRADGHGTVLREYPVTGSVLWTARTSRPLPDLADGVPAPVASVRHGVVAVDGPAGWALTLAGFVLGEWYPQGPALPAGVRRAVDLSVLADGRLLVTDATAGRLGGSAGRVVTPTGRPGRRAAGDDVAFAGRVLTPVVDDGSASDVLLTVPVGAGQVVALDARSGAELWRAGTRAGSRALVLDGRLVVQDGRGVRALDVRTGAVRWVGPPGVVPSGPDLLSDGEVVVVPVIERGRGPVLVALGLADGRERWRLDGPRGVRRLVVLDDGRLLALGDRETTALG